MSSLVSNFLIQPVLRQARRFSRADDDAQSRPQASRQQQHVLLEGEEGEMQPDAARDESLLGQAIVSSPTAEDGPDEVSSRDRELSSWNRSNTDTVRTTQRLPVRLASLQLPRTDNDTSVNPSFGTPSRFQPRTSDPTTDVRMDSVQEAPHATDDDSSSAHSRQRSGSLPEDDGMRELRRKIAAIQRMGTSSEEKARMMHNLLTESYSQRQTHAHARAIPRSHSPISILSQDHPITPSSASPSSFGLWPMGMTPNTSPSRVVSLNLTPEDLEPTFAPPKPAPVEGENHYENYDNYVNDNEEESDEPVLGCPHYRRNVKIQCSQCHAWYTCRFCHDEVEEHALIRKDTKNMLCMLCSFPQPVAQTCARCGEEAAYYYCSICKLFDNDPSKSIYHCDDCGICRVGRGLGKDFIHCKTCGVCMSIAIEKSHKCIERSTDCDCPICGEYMFSSPLTVVFMKCGHSIHHKCYYEHMKSSYKCPICSKSIVNMETQFRNLDRAIDNQPMPPQFQGTKAMVHCNDCYAKSAVKYHWLGLKCAICDSYNTAQLQILSEPEGPEGGAAPSEQPLEGHPPDLDRLPPPTNQILTPTAQALMRNRRYSERDLIPIASRFNTSPQRMARSVSPSLPFGQQHVANTLDVDRPAAEETENEEESDSDSLSFWGYHNGPQSREHAVESEEDDGEECEDDESEASDAADCDDDDDDGDEMELFGHR